MERASTIQLPSGLLFLLPLFIVIFAYIRWEDVVIRHPDGTLSIDDEIADKVADRLDRIHNRTVLYKLVLHQMATLPAHFVRRKQLTAEDIS